MQQRAREAGVVHAVLFTLSDDHAEGSFCPFF